VGNSRGGVGEGLVYEQSSICYAVFDRALLLRTRESMPVQTHRRPDIYYAPTTAAAATAAAPAAPGTQG
jgi:hypothetical protein